jgi:rRNA maturation protein Nop10
MKLKKCAGCKQYNLTEKCRVCWKKTEDAHYKFIKIKSEAERHLK